MYFILYLQIYRAMRDRPLRRMLHSGIPVWFFIFFFDNPSPSHIILSLFGLDFRVFSSPYLFPLLPVQIYSRDATAMPDPGVWKDQRLLFISSLIVVSTWFHLFILFRTFPPFTLVCFLVPCSIHLIIFFSLFSVSFECVSADFVVFFPNHLVLLRVSRCMCVSSFFFLVVVLPRLQAWDLYPNVLP